MWWLWIIVIIAVLLFIAGLSFIHIKLYFNKMQDNDDLTIEVKALYGVIRYRYKVPQIQYKGFFDGILFKTESKSILHPKPNEPVKKEITREKLVELYRNGKFLLQHAVGITRWMGDLFAHFRVYELRWRTSIGVSDAAHTAIINGMLWGLKYSLLGYASKYIRLSAKPQISVLPLYNRTQFTTELSCIGKIRLGYAICAGLLLIVRIMRAKGGIKAWQNILFKA